MRWQGQKIQNDDGGALLPLKGLVRSVRTPEFEGVTFHEVAAKTALNRVPGQSNMPFEWTINPTRGCLHRCVYCLSPDTLILMADGHQKPLREVKVGDRIIGTRLEGRYRRFTETEVLAKWGTRKPAYRVTLNDGTELTASGDHRFLTERGWKHVAPAAPGERQRPYLTANNRLMGFGLGSPTAEYSGPSSSRSYRKGYLTGMIRGDGMLIDRTYQRKSTGALYRVTHFRLALADHEALERSRQFLAASGIRTSYKPYTHATETRRAISALHTSTRANYTAIQNLIDWPRWPDEEWHRGYLAGFFDAEGSYSGSALRFSNSDQELLSAGLRSLRELGFDAVQEPANAKGVSSLRVKGGRASHRRFFHLTAPSITRKFTLTGRAVKTSTDLSVTYVQELGARQQMMDITTGTGNFIANGVVSHNCFARKTHEYLDLDSGRDFDSQIIVKTNVAEVLRAELSKPSWKREHVALGTNSDPYMRAEGRYRLMPGIIEALAESGTPFSILTKGPLLKRDLPVLRRAAEQVPVSIAVSLAMVDTERQQKVEPGTPDPRARLNLIRSIVDAGLEVNVLAMPVLPWLTDSAEHLDALHQALAEAGASWVSTGALHLRPGAREWFLQWLAAEFPHLVARYRRLYRSPKGSFSSYASKDYRQWLGRQAAEARRRHGFIRPADSVWRDRTSPETPNPAQDPAQPALF